MVHVFAQSEPHWMDDDWGEEIPLNDVEMAKPKQKEPIVFAKCKNMLNRLFSRDEKKEVESEKRLVVEQSDDVCCLNPACFDYSAFFPVTNSLAPFVDMTDVYAEEVEKMERQRKRRSRRASARKSKQNGGAVKQEGWYL